MPLRVLIAEDDRKLAGLLVRGLGEVGIEAEVVQRGDRVREALRQREGQEPDVLVLDVLLPGADGFTVCRQLRAEGIGVPILMLTARTGVEDRVQGLDGGADDYVAKPFSFEELVARLRALARRGPIERPQVLVAGDLRYEPRSRRAWRADTELDLSTTERALLETLLRHRGQVLDRDQLLAHAWSATADHRSNVVDVYVRYLREKVDRPFGVTSIETVRGTGYRLRADGGRPPA